MKADSIKIKKVCKIKLEGKSYRKELEERVIPKFLNELLKKAPTDKDALIWLIQISGLEGYKQNRAMSPKQLKNILEGKSSTREINRNLVRKMEGFEEFLLKESVELTEKFEMSDEDKDEYEYQWCRGRCDLCPFLDEILWSIMKYSDNKEDIKLIDNFVRAVCKNKFN